MHSVRRNARFASLLTLLLAAQGAAVEPPVDDRDAAQPAKTAAASEAVTSPDGGGSSAIEGLVAPARTKRLVYACREASIPMFSDRPCGDDARTRMFDLPATVAAGSVPSTRPAAAPAATRPIAAPGPRGEPPAPPDRCARLEEAIAAIDARMRQGYSAREAARLWERWRAAKAKLRDARC